MQNHRNYVIVLEQIFQEALQCLENKVFHSSHDFERLVTVAPRVQMMNISMFLVQLSLRGLIARILHSRHMLVIFVTGNVEAPVDSYTSRDGHQSQKASRPHMVVAGFVATLVFFCLVPGMSKGNG